MNTILEVINLNYQDFKDINISFNSGTMYSIIGGSKSGKTTLFKLLASLIPTTNMISCNGVMLDNNYYDYLVNIGIVERVNKNSFIYSKVIDEMMYPLLNLGFSKKKALKRINEVLEIFDSSYMLDKYIKKLNTFEKQKLLIIISLLHEPSILLLDSVLDIFSDYDKKIIVNKLRELVNVGLTVINFTKKLDMFSDKIILLDKMEIVGEYDYTKVYEDDQLFYNHNIEIPFITDLSIKLKMYGLVNKEYRDMKEMVDDIWP